MSQSQTAPETGECRHCETEHPIATAVGAFCSTECRHRHRAEKALNQVRQDHRLCGTCGGVLKKIERPDDEWIDHQASRLEAALANGAEYRGIGGELTLDLTECDDVRRTAAESICGFQHRTEDAELVVKEREGPNEYRPLLQTATGCQCGATDHSSTADVLRESDPARVLTNYVHVFRLLEQEGALQQRLDKSTFFETYRETRDFELAIGRALYTP